LHNSCKRIQKKQWIEKYRKSYNFSLISILISRSDLRRELRGPRKNYSNKRFIYSILPRASGNIYLIGERE
jgi:hypothetical protein